LNIHDVVIDDKTILYAYIPESSQVHRFLGKVYDRNEDGDFDISNNPDLVRQLHLRKQGSFSENTIYKAITLEDLRIDLIQRSRILANNNKPGHPWMELNDEQMLRSANLWKKDWKTGDKGYTLAAALLLGKDEVIQQIVPYYKTDAILRRENTDRYDDREIVKTNLLESYDKLMAFIALYTNGLVPIFEEGDIFRTIIPVIVRSNITIDPAIDEAIDEAINGSFDEATPETKNKLSILLKAIINDEGRRKPDYLKYTNIGSESTIVTVTAITGRPPLRRWVEICVASSISNNEEASPVGIIPVRCISSMMVLSGSAK
jgi:hypothetical protein